MRSVGRVGNIGGVLPAVGTTDRSWQIDRVVRRRHHAAGRIRLRRQRVQQIIGVGEVVNGPTMRLAAGRDVPDGVVAENIGGEPSRGDALRRRTGLLMDPLLCPTAERVSNTRQQRICQDFSEE